MNQYIHGQKKEVGIVGREIEKKCVGDKVCSDSYLRTHLPPVPTNIPINGSSISQ